MSEGFFHGKRYERKFARAYSEAIGLRGEHSTRYAVRIFSSVAALRWIQANVDVAWNENSERFRDCFRLLRVRTLSQMQYAKKN